MQKIECPKEITVNVVKEAFAMFVSRAILHIRTKRTNPFEGGG